MRVIAGSLGGRRLVAPAGRDVRPTADRVREALFAILAPVEGARVLDLFAGSGALAIEALSRGAASATLVDSSPAAIAAARLNVRALSLTGVEFHRADALAFLRRARARARQYDLVFIDPPYRLASAFGDRLSEPLMPVLAVGARVVFESGRRAPAELALPLLDERRYGETLIRIHGTRQPHRDLPGHL
jgi:16S rRNA (guanine966-N2)-methyltransferase